MKARRIFNETALLYALMKTRRKRYQGMFKQTDAKEMQIQNKTITNQIEGCISNSGANMEAKAIAQ